MAIDAPVRWGIVGFGRHAERYLAPAIEASGNSRLTAVYARSPERCDGYLGAHPGVERFATPAELVSDGTVDCVLVASATLAHEEHVALAAAAGRPVLCEKPLAETPETAVRIVRRCAELGVPLGVAFHLRFNEALSHAAALLAGGSLGEVVAADVTYLHAIMADERNRPAAAWRHGGSPIARAFGGTGAHVADLVLFLFGPELELRSAFPASGSGRAAHGTGGGEPFVVDSTWSLSGGAVVRARWGRAIAPANGVEVLATRGKLRVRGALGNVGGGSVEVNLGDRPAETVFAPSDVYRAEVEAFAADLLGGPAFPCRGEEGAAVTRLGAGVEAAAVPLLRSLETCP